ncbi:MAG: hypothetical protein Q8O92_12415 [Candidatus Latescibacter sp.]|nr:hypothetical protein [Candidatus Latescibacter sp.]
MNLLEESDMEYPLTVSVSRAAGSYDELGNYTETMTRIIEDMPADIQLSLKLRQFSSEDATGLSDKSVWVMYCLPPQAIREGDRVSDGTREFTVDVVGDWGSHVECVMRRKG